MNWPTETEEWSGYLQTDRPLIPKSYRAQRTRTMCDVTDFDIDDLLGCVVQ